MKSLLLDKNNNIVAAESILTVEGIDALTQDLNCDLRMTKGEYPFNTSLGIDYLDCIRNNDKERLLNEISSTIAADERVVSFDMTTTNEGHTLSIKINTKTGETANVSVGS